MWGILIFLVLGIFLIGCGTVIWFGIKILRSVFGSRSEVRSSRKCTTHLALAPELPSPRHLQRIKLLEDIRNEMWAAQDLGGLGEIAYKEVLVYLNNELKALKSLDPAQNMPIGVPPDFSVENESVREAAELKEEAPSVPSRSPAEIRAKIAKLHEDATAPESVTDGLAKPVSKLDSIAAYLDPQRIVRMTDAEVPVHSRADVPAADATSRDAFQTAVSVKDSPKKPVDVPTRRTQMDADERR